MKELVSAITQATANRLRSPFLGSFVLAWLAINHVQVIEFIFSDSAVKIMLVKNREFEWTSDAIFPLATALLYTFALPFVQHYIDVAKHWLIDDKRTRANHDRLKDKYESLSEASEQQARASVDYWREKLNRDLDRWDEERVELQEQLASLQATINNNNETISTQTATNAQLEKDLASSRTEAENHKNVAEQATRDKSNAEATAFAQSELNKSNQEILQSIATYCEHIIGESTDALHRELVKHDTSEQDTRLIASIYRATISNTISRILRQINDKQETPLTSPMSPASDDLATQIANIYKKLSNKRGNPLASGIPPEQIQQPALPLQGLGGLLQPADDEQK